MRALGERLQVDLAAALSLAVAHSQNAQPRLLALWDELAAPEVDELLAPEAGVAEGADDRKIAPALQRVMGYLCLGGAAALGARKVDFRKGSVAGGSALALASTASAGALSDPHEPFGAGCVAWRFPQKLARS